MRMLLKAQMETRKANQANQDGTLPQAIQRAMSELQPEAAYFYPENGQRTALFVFDMEDPSQIPPTLEPFFQATEARVTLTPVMTGEDLQKGRERAHG